MLYIQKGPEPASLLRYRQQKNSDKNGQKAEYAGILLWYLRKKLHSS